MSIWEMEFVISRSYHHGIIWLPALDEPIPGPRIPDPGPRILDQDPETSCEIQASERYILDSHGMHDFQSPYTVLYTEAENRLAGLAGRSGEPVWLKGGKPRGQSRENRVGSVASSLSSQLLKKTICELLVPSNTSVNLLCLARLEEVSHYLQEKIMYMSSLCDFEHEASLCSAVKSIAAS